MSEEIDPILVAIKNYTLSITSIFDNIKLEECYKEIMEVVDNKDRINKDIKEVNDKLRIENTELKQELNKPLWKTIICHLAK